MFLEGTSLGSYLADEFVSRVGETFPDEETALEAAAATAEALAQLPLGVLAPEQVGGSGAAIVLTDRNLPSFDLFGLDLSLAFFLTDRWSIEGTIAAVSDDRFETGSGPTAEVVALNAPSFKGSVAVGYRNPSGGLSASLRGRALRGFPASSGVYSGDVSGYGVVDLSLGYRFGKLGLWVQLDVQNMFDEAYTAFPGAPSIGRLTLLRLRYDVPRI